MVCDIVEHLEMRTRPDGSEYSHWEWCGTNVQRLDLRKWLFWYDDSGNCALWQPEYVYMFIAASNIVKCVMFA